MPFVDLKFNRALLAPLVLLSVCILNGCSSNKTPPTATRSADPRPQSTTEKKTSVDAPLIVALGDSLTAGYGLQEGQSYPTLLQARLDQAGYNYRVVNAGVSGDTSAGGVRRIDWALKGDVKIVILELGANDGLRGQPPEAIRKNLAQIIEASQKRGAKVILAGMEALPNLGVDYTRDFRAVYPALAREYDIPLIPFFLIGVAGNAELNQADGIHPNVRGTALVVDTVWQALEPLLTKD